MRAVSACALALLVMGTPLSAKENLDALDVEALSPLARAEGKVVVYSFTSRIGQVERAFEAAYPGIDMIGFDMSSTEQIARIKSEARAGLPGPDVAYLSDAPTVLGELLEEGLVAPYAPPRLAGLVPEDLKHPLLAQRLSTKVLMYNEEAYPEGAPVANLWELTTRPWKGRVVMVDPLLRGDYLDLMAEIVLRSGEMAKAYEAAFGAPIRLDPGIRSAGEQFIADLFANDLILTRSTDEVNAAVGARGRKAPPVGFSSYSDRRDNQARGWALQVAHEASPSSGIVFPALLAVNPRARHPAAARLAIDFLMGDDSDTGGPGFAPFYVAGDWAARTDVLPHPEAIPLDAFNGWRVDPEATAAVRAEVADFILTLQ